MTPLNESIKEISLLVKKSKSGDHSQLNNARIVNSKLLIDLPKKYIELLRSPSRHFPSLTKHAAHSILTYHLRSDCFFENKLSEVETFESLAWYLFQFKDKTCLYKYIIKSKSTRTLSDCEIYDLAHYVPPIFTIWAKTKGLLKKAHHSYKEIYSLYYKNRECFSECCADSFIDPDLYCSTPPQQRNLIHENSNDLKNLVSDWGFREFPYLTSLLGKDVKSIDIDHAIIDCFYTLAINYPQSTNLFDKFGLIALKRLRALSISLSPDSLNQLNKSIPIFPLYCYLSSLESNNSELVPDQLIFEHDQISRANLAEWFFNYWIPRFPSSLALCSQSFRETGEGLNLPEKTTNTSISHEEKTRICNNQRTLVPNNTGQRYTQKQDLSDERIVIVANWNHPTGLTKNAEMSASALKEAGAKIFKYDLDIQRNFCKFTGTQKVLIHINADQSPTTIMQAKCSFSNLRADLVAGFYLWETEEIPPIHELGVALVDKIITPTDFVANAYKKYDQQSEISVVGKAITPPSVSKNNKQSTFIKNIRTWAKGRFIFFTSFDSGSGIERKNPLSLIRAYIDEFDPYASNTVLIIKAGKQHINHWGDPFDSYEKLRRLTMSRDDIKLIDSYLIDNDLNTLMLDSSCIVSTHRAEGFGYLMAYALLLRKPLISTSYSGFRIPKCFPKYYPVEYQLVPTPNGKFYHDSLNQQWAQPSHASLRNQLRACMIEALNAKKIVAEEKFYEKFEEYYSSSAYRERLTNALILN